MGLSDLLPLPILQTRRRGRGQGQKEDIRDHRAEIQPRLDRGRSAPPAAGGSLALTLLLSLGGGLEGSGLDSGFRRESSANCFIASVVIVCCSSHRRLTHSLPIPLPPCTCLLKRLFSMQSPKAHAHLHPPEELKSSLLYIPQNIAAPTGPQQDSLHLRGCCCFDETPGPNASWYGDLFSTYILSLEEVRSGTQAGLSPGGRS